MAITLVASVTAAPGANGGTTAAMTTTGADLLVVGVARYTVGAGPVTVSDNKGNTWVPLTDWVAGFNAVRFYYCLSPTVGAGHTVTASGTGNYLSILAYAFAGAGVGSYQTERGITPAQLSPLGCGTVTPSANGALVLALITHANVATDSLTAGFTVATVPYAAGVTMQGSAGWYVQPTAAAINPTWTWTGGDATTVADAVFLPAAAAAVETVQPYVWGPL